jgi:8-oxo-dGTP pyrophosphatase MutT (NUDIX family)
MARSGHIADIRAAIGSRLLLMPSVSNAVLDPDDRLLLVRHTHHGMWGTPGGAMEPGETPAQAAARELFEETRLSLTPEALVGVTGGPDHVIRYPNGDETAYVTTIFAVRWDGQPIRPDGTEVDAYRWVAPEERDDVPMDGLTRRNVAIIFRWLDQPPGQRSARFEPSADSGPA